ncbi:MAG TPA: universal stress protein [Polyangiaceae bacterium]|nr:universal stress protein [Polyangiaceae bacterium]
MVTKHAGTHGHHGVSRMLLGSVAEYIVRLSPVPVLTVSAASAPGRWC